MKILKIQIFILFLGVVSSAISFITIKQHMTYNKKEYMAYVDEITTRKEINEKKAEEKETTEKPKVVETTTTKVPETTSVITTTKAPEIREIIFDNLNEEELTNRLNKNLYDKLAGSASYFVNYTKETGLDPYLAVAILNHETGCKWGCSKLARECNNVGGIKGSPSCNGGSYKYYETLEDGIKGYLDLIFNNYYKEGLTTPELINPKYAESASWADQVNAYIKTIRES